MKQKSILTFRLGPAFAAVLALCLTLPLVSRGRDVNELPRFKIQDAPINRETRGVTSYAPIIKRAAPSVVNIYSTRIVRERPWPPFFNDPWFHRFFGPDFDPRTEPGRRPRANKEQGLGSGVIVSSDGYILTANHVVDGADEVKVALATDGKEFTARVVGMDRPTDIAVLKVDAKDLPAIAIADSDKLEVGDVVLAIGNPFQVGQTVTMGIVSALGRGNFPFGAINEYEDFIQTDAAINPGNSGGALVDAEGRLIGINTAIISGSGGYQGVGFAVPINLARSVMERLIKFGKVTRGSIGVRLQPEITPDLAQEFHLPDQSGAMVTEVLPNTPASKAGLLSGDVIREVDGKPVDNMRQLRLMISQKAPGTKVTLTILRGEAGKQPAEKSIAVTLATLPNDQARRGDPTRPGREPGPDRDSLDGVEVADLDGNSRRQLDIPREIQGALVVRAEEGSNSAEAGLRQGDVILEINRQTVRSAEDAVDLSKKAKGNRVLLRVWRDGGSFFITVNNSKQD
jgi:serine protease Do